MDKIMEEWNKSRQEAFALANDSYQKALVAGEASWSGSSLKGRALEWDPKYAHSRNTFKHRLEKAGVDFQVVRMPTTRRQVGLYGATAIDLYVSLAADLRWSAVNKSKSAVAFRRAVNRLFSAIEAECWTEAASIWDELK